MFVCCMLVIWWIVDKGDWLIGMGGKDFKVKG